MCCTVKLDDSTLSSTKIDINSARFKSLHEIVSLQSDINIIQSNVFQGENKGKK